MWYVVQVTSGQEAKVCAQVRRANEINAELTGRTVMKECFVPVYQVEQKFHGEYKLMERNLFPGYVIAITNSVGELNALLRRISLYAKILGNDKCFIPLDRSEMAFINSFTSEKHRVIRTSKAVSEGDEIRVMEGPMVGHEGWIKQINRRKGTARIETTMFGRTINVEIGLAVVG